MKQTAILLPVDNRPITYLFPQLMCQLAGLEVLAAPRHLMGSLDAPINIDALWHWLEQTISQIDEGAVFVCLDSLLYGGLIPGRRSNEGLEIILARANRVANLKKTTGGKLKIYAQSSIMRISDNYDNTEEKSYWSKYGREIFRWSELLHKKEIDLLKTESELQTAQSLITPEVRSDYLATRTRNFTINQKIIEYVASGYIDYLIFSQDDSGKYGLNVLEKDKLLQLSKEKKVDNICAYAGADEVLMSLVAYHLNYQRQKKPQIIVEYSSPTGKEIASNYEGQNIGNSLECQAHAQGLQIVSPQYSDTADNASISNPDFTVIVHTALDKQGDHIWLPGLNDLRRVESSHSSAKTIALIERAKTPVIICDVAYSNGSDPMLIELLLKHSYLFEKIWSYTGWNTTGNTIGCALAVGSACLNAITNNKLNEQLRRALLWLRLMDDWAYQTQVRKILMECQSTDKVQLSQLMDKYAEILNSALNFKPASVEYSLPWRRTFEIEIDTNLP
jgi:Protein of unknown function (DUF4127)